jgi:MotA/TolQ/ExbB proton channel family
MSTVAVRQNVVFQRKLYAGILGIAGVPIFVGGLVVTAIQLFYSIRYLEAIGKSDLNNVAMRIPPWSRPLMVDLALVAPALVCFTGACMVYGAWRVIFRPAKVVDYDTFPFPRRYKTYYVQYGLLGTVIGFVIGFYNLNTKSEQAPIVLLAALSASLWSTLTAIALAYLVCPIIENVFQRSVIPSALDQDPLEVLRTRAYDAASALERLATTTVSSDIGLGLQTLASELISIRKDLAEAIGNLQSTERRTSALDQEVATLKSGVANLRVATNDVRQSLDGLQQQAAALRKECADGDQQIRAEVAPLQARVNELSHLIVNDRKQRRNQIVQVVRTGGILIERLRRGLEG